MTRFAQGFAITALTALGTIQMAALRTAAGGNPNGRNGFARFVAFLDTLGDNLMWVAAPVAVLALICAGVMIMVGKSEGGSFAAGAAIGIALVLLSPSIMA